MGRQRRKLPEPVEAPRLVKVEDKQIIEQEQEVIEPKAASQPEVVSEGQSKPEVEKVVEKKPTLDQEVKSTKIPNKR